MKTLLRDQARELLNQYWSEMKSEWFKLEVLQEYTGEDDSESLQRWHSGDRGKSLELLRTDPDPEFTQSCHKALDRGVKLLRVRIVQEPMTPYTQWEMEFYRLISQPLRGEQVFIINKSAAKDLELPKGDMMIFEETRVAVNAYDKNGLVISTDFYDHDKKVGDFLRLKSELQKRAEVL